MNKHFSLVALGAATIAATQALLSLPVGAVDAPSDIEVGIPDVIYLKTFSKFVCNFPASALIDPGFGAVEQNNDATIATSVVVGRISADVNDTVNFTGTPFTTLQNCDAQKAFAVWGTGGTNGNVKVDVARLSASSTGSGNVGTGPGTGNTLALAAVAVSTGSTAVASAVTTGNITAPGLVTPVEGNIRMRFNITGANRSGNYTGVKFKITATSN